jgi:hypothetical protein
LTQEVLNDAAGSGDARYARFEQQVRVFAEEWRAFFVPAILAGEIMTVDAVGARPAFGYAEESEGEVLSRSLLPLTMLLALTLLVTAPAVAGLGRVRGGD